MELPDVYAKVPMSFLILKYETNYNWCFVRLTEKIIHAQTICVQ